MEERQDKTDTKQEKMCIYFKLLHYTTNFKDDRLFGIL